MLNGIFKEENVWKSFPSKHDWFGGWAKRMGELQAEAYAIQNGKSNVSIVRPANVYGPYDNFDTDNAMVIPSLIRKAHENEFLSVWGDGSPIRDFIYSEDVARGMLHMVKNKVTEPVNLGSGTGVTIKELATTIASELGREIKWDTDKPMGDKIRLFDTNRAESYGFKPKTKLEDGISNTVKWFLDNLDIVDKRYNVFNK
jgi:GDP-L-fucose synthase